jgi:AcrR family transcriptional regulator
MSTEWLVDTLGVMSRDAEATRRRLLDAATQEFAAYGIAGSRVDRIAAVAQSNKAQIYHYFGSKDGLFDAVFDAMCRETVDAVPIDPADLPEYAGRLFDSYEERPYVQRLATWYRLERAGTADLLPIVLESNTAKVAAVAAAQADGTLPARFSPVDLLGLVLHLAGFWSSNVPEFDALLDPGDSTARRRRIVVDAVAALLT